MSVHHSQPVQPGHTREGWPGLWGWKEVVQYSGREDTTVRQMRAEDPGFPGPVAELSATPVYVTDEVTAYFDARPRMRTRITAKVHDNIRRLRESGYSVRDTAAMLNIAISTVQKYQDIPVAEFPHTE